MTDAQVRAYNNLLKKSEAADNMFTMLVEHMNNAERFRKILNYNNPVSLPSWLQKAL